MATYQKEDWRTCGNCIHSYVCRFRTDKDPASCANHIYNADPKTYGDLKEITKPACEWIRAHYPSDGVLVVDKVSAEMRIPIHAVYNFDE
jgi:hypothetical protein